MMNSKTAWTLWSLIALPFVLGAGGCSRSQPMTDEAGDKVSSTANDYLFADDFEGKILNDWEMGVGSWRASRGVLTLWGRGSRHDTRDEVKIITLSRLRPMNCRIEVDLRFLSDPEDEAFAGILFRYDDPFNYYWFRFCNFEQYQDRYEIYEIFKGQRHIGQGQRQITFNPIQWYRLAVEVEGANIRAYLDGEEVIDLVNPNLEVGTVGLAAKKTAKVEFRRFRVLAL